MWKTSNLKKFINLFIVFIARRCAPFLLVAGAVMLAAETRALPVLDTTFGTGSMARIGAPGGAEDGPAASILVEPAGKVLLAGFSDEGARGDFMLARLNENGLPDTSFGSNGRVLPKQFSYFVGSARAVEQANGAITVAAGTAAGSYGHFATVTAFRLNAAGVLDAAFTPALAAPRMANATVALGVRPDSRLLYGTASYAEGAVLQQLLADGTPDSSFGSNGKVAFPLDEGEFSQESDLLVQADGSVVFAVLTDKKLRVFKLDARGLPLASFGAGGQFSYAQSFEQSAGDRALSLLALADGSLLAAIGTSKRAAYPALPSSSLLAIRIAPNGAPATVNS